MRSHKWIDQRSLALDRAVAEKLRAELEHIIRAASGITSQPDLVVVSSQAVLAQFPDAPAALLNSMEADIYPRHRPDLSIQIDGAIGERSLFHETFGYYAHGVDETTATVPPDRLTLTRERLRRLQAAP